MSHFPIIFLFRVDATVPPSDIEYTFIVSSDCTTKAYFGFAVSLDHIWKTPFTFTSWLSGE